MPSLGLGLSIDKSGVVPNPIIPASLAPNAIALYTTRPQGLSDFAVNMTNAVTNGDFSQGTTGWSALVSTISVSDGSLKITGNGTNANPRARQNIGIAPVSGTQYAVTVTFKVTNASASSVSVQFKNSSDADVSSTIQLQSSPVQNQLYTKTVVVALNSSTGTNFGPVIGVQYADAATANGKTLEVYAVMVNDISTPFGLTNEPTASEFSDMLTYKGKSYWNGTEPVVINPNDKYYWPDRSGNGRHLHAVNVAYDATGGVQAGPPANWLCDGVNDYLVFNSATDIVAANGAVSAFVVFQAKGSIAANHRVFQLANGTSAVIYLSFIGSNTVTCRVYDSVTGFQDASITGLSLLPDKWYSGAVGYDPATKRAFLSLNGANVVYSGALTNGMQKINKFVIAANSDVTGFNNDRISEYPVLNKVLSQAEIKQLHNNIASRYGLTKV